MNTLRTRIARLTAASVLVVGLGALASGPAFAAEGEPVSYELNGYDFTAVKDGASTDAEGEPVSYSVTLSADDDASTDGVYKTRGV